MAESAGGWRGLHVYRYGAQDEFLLDGLAPVVTPLLDNGGLASWFFLRYWQGGHHVRVRLRPADPAIADELVAEVTAKLSAYLAEFPGGGGFDAEEFHREAQPTMAALEREPAEPIQPPDTIRAVEYRRELGKYGGERGALIAERYFARSSSIILEALRASGNSSSKRLGSGFSMMLRGLAAAGMSATEMAAFFKHYCLLWSPYTFDQFLDTWPDLLATRRAAMGAHAGKLLSAGDVLARDPFHQAVSSAWSEVDSRVLDEVTLAGQDATGARRRQVLLVSYLHTHNNRLGLIPEHESFLGYLGHHVLSEIADAPATDDLLALVREHRSARLENN